MKTLAHGCFNPFFEHKRFRCEERTFGIQLESKFGLAASVQREAPSLLGKRRRFVMRHSEPWALVAYGLAAGAGGRGFKGNGQGVEVQADVQRKRATALAGWALKVEHKNAVSFKARRGIMRLPFV